MIDEEEESVKEKDDKRKKRKDLRIMMGERIVMIEENMRKVF